MRAAALTVARGALLAGPAVLAFFSGGYFDTPRVWAGVVAWVLVALAALLCARPLPRRGPGRLTLAGLALLALWTLLSLSWAPLAGTAYHDGQRVILYLGALLAAAALLRDGGAALAEPGVAAVALVVVGYGVSERLLPGLLRFHASASAEGRLEQPLTYWNAMGALAALGVVLCARLAGDRQRPAGLRLAAAAAAAPLGLGLYCSFSRGALFAGVAGLIALLVLAPSTTALRGMVLAVASAVLAGAVAAPFGGVTSLTGSHHTRVVQGVVVLALLVVVMLAAGLAEHRLITRERDGRLRDAPLRLPRHAGWLALVMVLAGFTVFLVAGAKEKSGGRLSGGASRLTTLQSNRYDYWRVAWRAFRSEPIHGVGGGGWAVLWLRERPYRSGAQDAHSLPIQTAAELGLVGLLLLGTFAGGVVWCARRAHRLDPALSAGPIAGVVVWGAHCLVDWDWEMPALTLLAILLIGCLVATADMPAEADALATPSGLPAPVAEPAV